MLPKALREMNPTHIMIIALIAGGGGWIFTYVLFYRPATICIWFAIFMMGYAIGRRDEMDKRE